MFPVDCLVVMSLLSAPPSTSAQPSIPYNDPFCCLMQHVAISWEIMDGREKKYVLSKKADFHSDLDLLRKRFQKLKNAPPVHDCHRFPSRKVISQMLAFNREYCKHLKERLAMDRTNVWLYQEALAEAERLYQLWSTIRDTRCDYYYVTVRRQALLKIQRQIGVEDFYNGNYPPHIPTWRFRWID